MYKKLILGIKFIVYFLVLFTICLAFNKLITGVLFLNFPGWDDIRYMVGFYPEESEQTVVLADLNVDESIDSVDGELLIPADYGIPSRITMASVNIDLPVQRGMYDSENQSWTISKGNAFWAELSDLPRLDGGNTVIYAHNQWTEFAKTRNLTIGDQIIVETDKGNILTYEFTSDDLVDPSWGALFDQEFEISRLTLITCNGVNDEYRRLIYADLVSVDVVEGQKPILKDIEISEEPMDFLMESTNIIYSRPIFFGDSSHSIELDVNRGWLSVAQLSQLKITNEYLAYIKDASYVTNNDSRTILFINTNDSNWEKLSVGGEFYIDTEANQKIFYTISYNEIVSSLVLPNIISPESGKNLIIVIQELDNLRVVIGEFDRVYSL